MTLRRGLCLVCAAAASLLAGCGAGGGGTATLWITRDQGRTVVLTTTVRSGQTAMQALRSVAEVETRYGGRFVQAIGGVEGSLAERRDWFLYLNGVFADRGAAEYRLRPGEIEWWDYRSWRGNPEYPIVAGAFPEPFVHGYDGRTRPTVVRFDARFPEAGTAARAIAPVVDADSVEPLSVPVPRGAHRIVVRRGRGVYASNHADPRGPVTLELGATAARRLAEDPAAYRFRFGVPW